MAHVAPDRQLVGWIDDYLDYLEREWRRLPAIARAWSTWDDDERLDFVVEWPIREDRLQQLQQWSNRGAFTRTQHDRHDDLVRLVEEYRPLLRDLLQT